jgi:trimeric autotransporter adhesin
MASTFSNLGLNLQATGENSGTWGAITNVNLQEIDAAIAGVFTITLTGSTTLAFTTNSSSTTYTDESGRNKTIILNGSLSATTVTVTVPNIEKDYVIINNSGGTVTVSSGGATTVNIGTGSKNYVIVDPNTTSVISAVPAANPGGSNTFVQYNNSNSFGGSSTFTFDGTTVTIVNATFSSTANLLTQSELRFQDTSGGQYVGLRASTTVATSFTLNLPTTSGTANQVITTDGSGNLSFATVSGGAAWQAVKTSNS